MVFGPTQDGFFLFELGELEVKIETILDLDLTNPDLILEAKHLLFSVFSPFFLLPLQLMMMMLYNIIFILQ